MPSISQVLPASRRDGSSPTQVLVIVCAGVVLASLDLFIVNVALPSIARDFGRSDLGGLSWVLNGYAIVYAALLIPAGRLADRHRRRSGFLLGVAVFTLASVACGLSNSVGTLVAFRLVQAAGAALVTPTSLGLILATQPAERRSTAVRTWTATGGLAAAFGPVVGGLLVAANWRWVFFVNVPVGLAALLVGWRRLPDVPGHRGPWPDAVGAIMVVAGVGALTTALVKGGDWGWASGATIGTLAASVGILALFGRRCRRHRNPLVPPQLFAERSFSGATVVALLFSASFGAMLLSVVLWGQTVWGWSALRTGLAIAPGPLAVPLVSFLLAGPMIRRFGAALVVGLGSASFAVGVTWWALAVGIRPDYPGGLLGGMVLTGVGVGFTLPTLVATATASLPPPSFATGSAVVNMVRQVGLALGVAMLVALLGSPGGAAEALRAFRRGWWVTAALAVAAALTAVMLRSPSGAGVERAAPAPPDPGSPQPIERPALVR